MFQVILYNTTYQPGDEKEINDLEVLYLFNSISVISGKWDNEYKRSFQQHLKEPHLHRDKSQQHQPSDPRLGVLIFSFKDTAPLMCHHKAKFGTIYPT